MDEPTLINEAMLFELVFESCDRHRHPPGSPSARTTHAERCVIAHPRLRMCFEESYSIKTSLLEKWKTLNNYHTTKINYIELYRKPVR